MLCQHPTGSPRRDHAPDPHTALATIESSRLGPAQKTALRLLSQGRSYREAARAAGLRSTADLKRHAQRFGLVEAHNRARSALVIEEREVKTATVIAELRQVAGKGTRELLRRLDQEAESIQTRDLTVLTGVALDKIAKWEKWDGDDREPGSASKLLDRLEAVLTSGASLSLTVSPRPPDADAIDVEAEPVERAIDVMPA